MTSGIYAIVNTVTDEEYVGCSTDIWTRWRAHLADLKARRHHSQRLQQAYNIYGENALRLLILEEVRASHLFELYVHEKRYIQQRKPAYNHVHASYQPRSTSVFVSLPPQVTNAIDDMSDGMRSCYLRELIIQVCESGLPKLDLSKYVDDPQFSTKRKLRESSSSNGEE